MKKIIIIMMLCATTLLGCPSRKSEFNINNANDITVFYSYSSYAMFGAGQEVIDHLVDQLNSLGFKETKDQQDFATAFSVTVYNGEIEVANFSVDANGVFGLHGKTINYKVFSGSFDYEYLKDIYEKSKTSEMHPDKAYLLTLVDEMTKPDLKNPDLAFSSNPYDYITAHKDIYDKLVAGGQSTVDIFVDILTNSNEFGLDKYIMAAVCAQITGIGNESDKTWASAKDWLILYEKTNNAVPDNTSGGSNSNIVTADANKTVQDITKKA